MRDVLLQRRPDRGTWDLVKGPDGNPVATDSELHAVLTQLLERRGSQGVPGWIWDSAAGSGAPGTHGSLLYLVTEDTPAQRDQAVAACLDALAPLVEEGRVRDVTARLVAASYPGRIDLVVGWLTPAGQPETTTIPIRFP